MTTDRMKYLGMLLTAYPAAAESKEQMRAWLGTLEIALEGISEPNVERAVKDFIQGNVKRSEESRSYRPSIAEIAAHARIYQQREDRYNKSMQSQNDTLRITDDWKPSGTEDQRKAHVEAAMKKLRTTMDTT